MVSALRFSATLLVLAIAGIRVSLLRRQRRNHYKATGIDPHFGAASALKASYGADAGLGQESRASPVRAAEAAVPTRFVSWRQQKTAGPTPFRSSKSQIYLSRYVYFLLTAFFGCAPGMNFATFRAAILIVATVCGLLPVP